MTNISNKASVAVALIALAASAVLLVPESTWAQVPGAAKGGGKAPGGGGKGKAKQAPQTSAPIDMTGTWVSVVTEDYMFRMVTPPKGQYLGVPMSQAARRVADAWDPAADEAAGNACKSYGAAAVMRVPGRIRVSWADPNIMKIETEAGTQTREFHFGDTNFNGAATLFPASTEASWQGYSVGEWQAANVGKGRPTDGDLKVVTTRLKPGYLRKNGVPYGANTVVTEYYDVHQAGPLAGNDTWLVVTTAVHDPENLTTDFITSTHFKKLGANAPWKPEACTAK